MNHCDVRVETNPASLSEYSLNGFVLMGQVLSVLVLPQIISTGNGLDFQNQQ